MGCLYKLVAKVMDTRYWEIMDDRIAKNQLTYIQGRHLYDGVVFGNKFVNYLKRTRKECMIFQVDLEVYITRSIGGGFRLYSVFVISDLGSKHVCFLEASLYL